MTEGVAVELAGIAKRFPGVVANDNVDLVVRAGEVHAIVGENGAGKSTLMKILYGMQAPDEGSIAVNGAPVRFRSPKDAIAVGIGMVHQHFMLADNLTVAENIILGAEPTHGGRLDLDAARTRIRELAEAYGMEVDPDELVETMTVGERQRVEILKVLFRGARILILDEPTAVLVPHEVDELFASLAELKAEGVTIIFISHKLDEVLAVADEITVIRAGRTVGTVKPADVTAETLAEMMVGSELRYVQMPPALSDSMEVLGLSVASYRVFLFIAAIVLFMGTWLLMNRTTVGMKLRAIMQDRSVAASFGINAKRVYALTFAYGAGLAGLAGALVSPLKSVSPDMGTGYVVDAFMVVVLGGVQSLAGTVASAFILGELSGAIAFLQNDTVAKALVLLAIVVLIRFRPEGLFTTRVRA